MAAVIDLPRNKDRISLADWMEVNAILNDEDNSSSIEDIISRLKISDEGSSDSTRADVSAELIFRQRKVRNAYPFQFNGQVLKLRPANQLNHRWAYIFCLFVSYVGVQNFVTLKIWKKDSVTQLFEKISGIAAQSFFAGRTEDAEFLHFGAPRSSWRESERPFRIALQLLKEKIKDGEIRNNPTAARKKDAGLDLVVWRSFPDQRVGKLMFFGQCAAGGNFREKKYDLLTIDNYFPLLARVSKGLFIPHELSDDDWCEFCYDSNVGIVFDRSRIAFYAKQWEGSEIQSKLPCIKRALKKKLK